MKYCSCCRKEKPEEEFGGKKTCQVCRDKRKRKWTRKQGKKCSGCHGIYQPDMYGTFKTCKNCRARRKGTKRERAARKAARDAELELQRYMKDFSSFKREMRERLYKPTLHDELQGTPYVPISVEVEPIVDSIRDIMVSSTRLLFV